MAQTSGPDQAIKATKWEAAQRHQAAALQAYTTGDMGPFIAGFAHTEEATIFGGFGGWQKGWQAIAQRLGWSSSQYQDGRGVREPLTEGYSGDLGYTVHLERISVRQGSSATPTEKTYRVTHIFRWDAEEWKLIHRHADPLAETHAPQ